MGAGEPSGLAMMLAQYFEQNIRDFPRKNEQASRIRGALAIRALEGDVNVTLRFKNGEIEILDGRADDAKVLICGGIFSLTELATGGASALRKFATGELKTHSAWKHPLLMFRVGRFMSLPAEMRAPGEGKARTRRWKVIVRAVAAAVSLGLSVYFLSR
ncbi:MAG: hypothetical protein C4532_13500 [Candidatus Abyssobacteria bacterium SURF_17]|uniref:SCP2 domain-containing protein n=1 Tax=Candidatus Abyssobacteria bacterium SURF_17 TaxID=2093361 RepID=A0A419EUS2_9BACT|nr:MAG: hypothetical protein C4532_13500 [Candidatus Abyssubacteria bacterium SURF_17]